MNTILKLAPNSVVLQPGDPIMSPGGNTTVQANNDGTASITHSSPLTFTFSDGFLITSSSASWSPAGTVKLKGPFSVTLFNSPGSSIYVPEDTEDPQEGVVYDPSNISFFVANYGDEMGWYVGDNDHDYGTISDWGTANPSFVLLQGANYTQTGTITISGPRAATTKTVATEDKIPTLPNLATVATTGSFNDLTDKPTIDTSLSSTSTNAVQNKVLGAKESWNLTCTYASGFAAGSDWTLITRLGRRVGIIRGKLKFTTDRSAGYSSTPFTFTLPSGAPSSYYSCSCGDSTRSILAWLDGGSVFIKLISDVAANSTPWFCFIFVI